MSQPDVSQLENLQQVLQAYQSGDIQRAYQLCKQFAQGGNPGTSILQFLGLISMELGHYQEALQSFNQAIQMNPEDPFLWSGFAQAFEAVGDINQASGCYQKALGIDPTCIEALIGLAAIFQQQKNYDDALVCYQAALRLEANSIDILNNVGSLYLDSGKYEDALATLQQVTLADPAFIQGHYNLGFAYKALNRLDEAKESFKKVIEIAPDFSEAYFQLGIIYKLLGLQDEELTAYQKSISIKPDNIPLQTRLGLIYSVQGKLDAAKETYQSLRHLEPNNPLWALRLASLMPIIASDEDAVLRYRQQVSQLLEELEKNSEPFPVEDIGLTFAIPPYHWLYHGVDDTVIRSQFADYLSRRINLDGYQPTVKSLEGRKIKIGFLCTENRENSMWALQGGFIQKLNKERFDISIICTPQTAVGLKERLFPTAIRFFDMPIEIPNIVKTLREEAYDVIHFFEVGSDPKNYFLPFYRMAPVQCTSWGILSTTGIPNMDFYLSSPFFEAPDAQSHYREKLVMLNSSLAYYEEPKLPQTILNRAALGLPEDKKIYASPHSLFKFQPAFDGYIKAILEQDPNGVVVFNESQNPVILADLQERLKRTLGSLYERVIFLGYLPWEHYISLIMVSDVLLDPLNFGGGVTSYNAFACGKPVITQPTSFLRGRVTAGMYQMMGITDCIADSKQTYVDKCIEIANHPDLAQKISEKILERKHVLFQDEAMVKEFELFLVTSVNEAIQV